MARKATMPMVLALLTVALGFAILLLGREGGIASPPFVYGGAYAGMMLGVYLIVRLWLPYADALLIPIVTLLTGVGLIMIYRAGFTEGVPASLATTQVVWVLVGCVVLLLTIFLFRNYQRLLSYKYLIALGAFVLIGLTFTPFGQEVNGARLWVDIGPVRFQPSEFARIALVIFFAGYLAEKRDVMAATSRSFIGIPLPPLKHFGPVAMVWAASLGLLVFEKDLGSSLLFFVVPLLMLYVATGKLAYVLIGSLLFAGGAVAGYFMFDHVQVRVSAWLDPWSQANEGGYQILQSIFAISEGGVAGTGLGEGLAGRIPEVQTDFIFSSVASELGLLGATALLMAFLVFAYRGLKIALYAPDDGSKLLAGGLTVMFALQTFIIVAGVTKLIPLTGITLPFVSYGGSSVVGNFILTGLLLVISNKAGRRMALGEEWEGRP
ncbi:FtsW/RodA/SpoVE family cell cycle protein [Rubrobacter aplysinae]|uniref:FtsW/RodA/SpoVE family cell cycle protein n=1 Tax=Rubrobacter aplysinae TaxID=909625 RepID=UPI00064C4239|nr:FtsW/RodA/SpoVE family cell cycle protein [Rubrobacter aplysinae]